jgi:hypothetical protein
MEIKDILKELINVAQLELDQNGQPDNFDLGHTTISQRSNWIGRESNHLGCGTDEEIDKMLDSKFILLFFK